MQLTAVIYAPTLTKKNMKHGKINISIFRHFRTLCDKCTKIRQNLASLPQPDKVCKRLKRTEIVHIYCIKTAYKAHKRCVLCKKCRKLHKKRNKFVYIVYYAYICVKKTRKQENTKF